MTPLLIVVGADKGGVGKTMVARALLDLLPTAQAFDTDGSTENGLSRFYPAAIRINAERAEDQMRVFDKMPSLTLVDIKAGLLSITLRNMRELGLLNDVAKDRLGLAVVHVLAANMQSLYEIADTAAQLAEGGKHFLLKNRVSADAHFFDFNEGLASTFLQATPLIELPHLDDRAVEEVDARGLTFQGFIADETLSLVLRRRVHYWLDQAAISLAPVIKMAGL